MEALEKAKLALRKHLLENKDRVAADLDEMRKKSMGDDIFKYVEKLSSAFSFDSILTSCEVTYDYNSSEIDCYDLVEDLNKTSDYYSPPLVTKNKFERKKALKDNQGFFFSYLYYVRSTKSTVFV